MIRLGRKGKRGGGRKGKGGKGVAGEEKRIQVLLVNEVTKLLNLCR